MHMKLQLSWFAIALIVNGILVSNSFGMENGSRDWPTYRSGNDRHGSTSDSITPSAQPSWTFQSPAAPKMSWGSAEGRIFESHVIGDRNKYDDALQPVVVGDQVFFGSSVDHHLHCLDLKTGRDRWSYTVGGPIRLAPTVYNNKVYFGADDGFAYCLSEADGSLVWKAYGSYSDNNWLLARGEMISRWPVRTGVTIDDGKAFFGAGIFPHEEIFIHCVDAETGKVIWNQDHISEADAGRNSLSPQATCSQTKTYFLFHQVVLFPLRSTKIRVSFFISELSPGAQPQAEWLGASKHCSPMASSTQVEHITGWPWIKSMGKWDTDGFRVDSSLCSMSKLSLRRANMLLA